MLTLILAVKLIAEIALLALFGQWVLGLLAGQRKQSNLFYQVLQQVGRPFVLLVRFVTHPGSCLSATTRWWRFCCWAWSGCWRQPPRFPIASKFGVQLCQ